MKRLFILNVVLLLTAAAISITTTFARSPLDTLFPLENYDQEIATWISPVDFSYDQQLLDAITQRERVTEFYSHFFGSLSPWNKEHVEAVLYGDIKNEEEQIFATYDISNTYYAANDANAIPYLQGWLASIKDNATLSQLDSLSYDVSHCAITTMNLAARILPTEQHAFLDPTLPGEGDTFDFLQMSAVWIGTPLYIIATTNDGAWDLVLTPDFIAWVQSKGVALADQAFIQRWSEAAQKKLIAITQTATPLKKKDGEILSLAYVGSCFPAGEAPSTIMVPAADQDHHAGVQEIAVTPEMSAIIPLSLTPHHMADIMSTLIGRPYAWGGLDFNNDCSAELKSLFTPFGIYLPRHSSDQVTVGSMVDKSSSSPDDRLSFLIKNGKPFLSLIYIGGHIILYIGKYQNPYAASAASADAAAESMAMTYQNLWGLRPYNTFPDRRAIIGKAVFFPLLLQYPEDSTLMSLADKSFFQIGDLSEFPASSSNDATIAIALSSAGNTGSKKKVTSKIDIHSMMKPGARENF